MRQARLLGKQLRRQCLSWPPTAALPGELPCLPAYLPGAPLTPAGVTFRSLHQLLLARPTVPSPQPLPQRPVAASRPGAEERILCSTRRGHGHPLTEVGRSLTVAVGLSGGVDSAVAALRLKQSGHEVVAVYMRNWDAQEEGGDVVCPVDKDFSDAQQVADTLGIPLHEIDFVAEYWTRVFEAFVEQQSRGLTPNPDLDCNRHIKFQALLEHVVGMGADALATGHYARVRRLPNGRVQLLKGADPRKDQTYFLASVRQDALQKAMFPIGELHKSTVRKIAAEANIHVSNKKGSRGICFIGKRPFGEFISQYADSYMGRCVSVVDGTDLGHSVTISSVTCGQGARIPGQGRPWFVAGKDVVDGVLYCAPGSEHPALFHGTASLREPFWVAGEPPEAVAAGSPFPLECKVRYGQPPASATICMSSSQSEAARATGMGAAFMERFAPSRFVRLQPEDSAAGSDSLHIRFAEPFRAVTPQQACVLYDDDVCLGGALIAHPGPSEYEGASWLSGEPS